MPEYKIRHYDPEKDLVSLSTMLTEIEAVDRDGEDTSEEHLRSMKDWNSFDPDQNVWVTEWNDHFVGYGQVLPRLENPGSLYVAVHPNFRRKGLGGKLLELALSRLSETETKKILVYANRKNTASTSFLEKRGFDVAGTSGVMLALMQSLPQFEFPVGYALRRYPEINDPQIVAAALNDCYKDMIGHHQNVTNADRFINYYGEEGIHLLFNEQDVLIGICAAKSKGRTDERGVSDLLDAPGLVKEYRQRGIQRPLTLAVMNWLREKGKHPITLEYWGDDDDIIEIYHSIGFEMINQQITYQKDL
ncbi:MAG: GNAT family N-acetyltransferase [Anaerolineales bacterium]|nr:GNAT family N-acetyltransferase [Anaerolineales bacterium]